MQERVRGRGVTLIETCMGLAVAGVLACTAVPGLQSVLETRRLQGAATQLAADIHFVRTEAISRNRDIRLSFYRDDGSSCYLAHTGAAGECRCLGTEPPSCAAQAEAIKAVQFPTGSGTTLRPNVSSILFDPLHGTSTPTGTLRIVGASGREVHHVVNLMGRVRSCSPRGAVPGYPSC